MPELKVDSRYVELGDDSLSFFQSMLSIDKDWSGRFSVDGGKVLQLCLALDGRRTKAEEEAALARKERDTLLKWQAGLILRGIPRDFFILEFLDKRDQPCTLNAIYRHLSTLEPFRKLYSVQKSTVWAALKRLIAGDFVEQEERGIYTIAEKGKALVERCESKKLVPR